MEEWQKQIEQRLADNDLRLADGDQRMTSIEADLKENTALTKQIADNTAGFSAFFNDLENGTKFMCRMARGVSWFLKEVVEPFWKPALICFLVVYWTQNDHKLPDFITAILKAFV